MEEKSYEIKTKTKNKKIARGGARTLNLEIILGKSLTR